MKNILTNECSISKIKGFRFFTSLVPNCASDVLQRKSIESQAFGHLSSNIWAPKEHFQNPQSWVVQGINSSYIVMSYGLSDKK